MLLFIYFFQSRWAVNPVYGGLSVCPWMIPAVFITALHSLVPPKYLLILSFLDVVLFFGEAAGMNVYIVYNQKW